MVVERKTEQAMHITYIMRGMLLSITNTGDERVWKKTIETRKGNDTWIAIARAVMVDTAQLKYQHREYFRSCEGTLAFT